MFRCNPSAANLGATRVAWTYRYKIHLLNAGNDIARFRVKPPSSAFLRVVYQPGPLAAGMSCPLEVEMTAKEPGDLVDSFDVVTENEVFSIPISAIVLNEEEFEAFSAEHGRLPPPRSRLRVVATAERRLGKVQTGRPSPRADTSSVSPSLGLSKTVEPRMPNSEKDWFIDPSKTVAELKASVEAAAPAEVTNVEPTEVPAGDNDADVEA